jgi:hypothetical protein
MTTDSGTYDDATQTRRKMAAALLGQTLKPEENVKHWAQGLANLAKAGIGGYMGYQADQEARQEKAQGQADVAAGIAALLQRGGAAAPVSSAAEAIPPVAAVAPPVAPSATGLPSDQASYPTPPAAGPAPITFRPGITAPAPTPAAPDATLPRGLRNNNPLNIEAGDFTKGQPGFVGSDGRFARFETPDQGIAAASKLLDTYESKYGLNTPAGIIGRWAPQGENNSAAYAATVAKKLGIGPNDPITPEMRPRLIAAMSEVENGRPAAPTAAPQIASALTAPTGEAALPPGATPAQGMLPTAAAAGAPAGSPTINAAAMSKLLNSTNPTARAMGMAVMQNAISDKVSYQTTPDGDILAMDPHGRAPPKVVYRATPKPIAVPENSQLWDPRTKTFMSGGPAAIPTSVPGPDGKPVPVPQNLSPRDAREFTKKIVEGTAAASLPPETKDVAKMREDFVQLPAYKNLAQAAPIYNAMRDAAGRDTKAADLNMVYGLGKIMDPTSVVREGEIQMAQSAQGLQERLNGIIAQIQSKGGLTPEGRQALMAEAHGRVTSYKTEFDRDAGRFKKIAERNRMNPEDVIPEFGSFEPWTAPKAKGDEAPSAAPPAGVDPKIWQHMTPEERSLWK